MPKQTVPVTSPIKGINRVVNREGQPPDTCWDALNMLPFDRYGRHRVSQRPGTSKAFTTQMSGDTRVQGMLQVGDIIYAAQNGSGAPGFNYTEAFTSLAEFKTFWSNVPSTWVVANNTLIVPGPTPAAFTSIIPYFTAGVAGSTITWNITYSWSATSTMTPGSQITINAGFDQSHLTRNQMFAGQALLDAGYGTFLNNSSSASLAGGTPFIDSSTTADQTFNGEFSPPLPGPSTAIAQALVWPSTTQASAVQGGHSTNSNNVAPFTNGFLAIPFPSSTMFPFLDIEIDAGASSSVVLTISQLQLVSPGGGVIPATQPAYKNFLVTVSNGFIYYGSVPGGTLTLALGQSTALLNPTVNVSMTFNNLIVYIVDGTNFVQLDLATGIATTVINVESPPSIAVPANPTLGQTGGGSFGSTNYLVRVAYLKNDGSQEVTLSGQSSTLVAANELLTVTSPSATGSVSQYQVYAAFLPLGYTLQAGNNGEASFGPEILQSTVNIGTNWTMPTTGLVFGTRTLSTGVTIGTGLPVGITPTNCSLLTNWRGRLVLAGDSQNPQNWYMSRAGSPLDWDYSQTDVAAAVAGNNGTAGKIGEPITCLIPFTDDLMKFGTVNSLWMMQGDPADGGTLTKVSDKMGIVGKDAWCVDPAGTLYFVATGGLYSVRPAWEFYRPPELMSGNSYDQFFSALSWSTENVALCWDEDHKYLEMFVMPADGSFGTHLIFDQRGEFAPWPQKFPTADGPSCVCRWLADGTPNDRVTLLGGQDGFIRQLDFRSLDDEGQPITASITLGPFRPMPEAAILTGVTIDFGEYFGTPPPSSTLLAPFTALVSLASGPDAFEVTEGSPHSISKVQVISERRTKTFRQRLRGAWFSVNLFNNLGSTYFSFESAALEFEPGGKIREYR